MTNPPEIPKDIIESYKKLSEAKQKRLEFMAAYPEYLLDKNRNNWPKSSAGLLPEQPGK